MCFFWFSLFNLKIYENMIVKISETYFHQLLCYEFLCLTGKVHIDNLVT